MKRLLSPSELARAVGVSESSLKRWVDEGRIKASRTAGGHRRIPISEAIRLIRQTGLPLRHPQMLGLPDLPAVNGQKVIEPADAAAMLHDALVGGDQATVHALVMAAFLDGRSLAELCDDLIGAAMRKIGALWTRGSRGIYIEHRATDLCSHALQSLRALIPRPDASLSPTSEGSTAADSSAAGATEAGAASRPAPKGDAPPREGSEPVGAAAPTALGGAAGGDQHTLASLMAAVVLAGEGFREINLGGDTPLPILSEAARINRACLVWVAMNAPRSSNEAARLARDIEQLAQSLPAPATHLVLGGNHVPPQSKRLSNTNVHHAGSMSELAAFARGLLASQRFT